MPDNVDITPGTGATIAADEIGVVKFQRMKLTLGADGVNDGDVASANPLPARVQSYNYPISTANSSTAQLTAGATFTGAWETPQDQPSLSILMTSDQPITITVQQAIDVAGTFRAPDIVFEAPANAGFARSLTINGNFVRLTARNNGPSTTTTFNLNVAFGSLGDADATGVQPVTEPPLVLAGASAQTATVNNILGPVSGTAGTNVSGYRTASVQVVSTGTAGTFIFEQSNDNANWIALPAFNAALTTGVPITAAITATVSQIIYTFPIRANFLRLRIASTITGGSIQAFSRLSTEPWTSAGIDPGAATEATLAGALTTTAFQARTPALGSATSANSSPVVIASDQSAVAVNQAGVSATGSVAALNAAVTLSLSGMTGFAVDVRGTFVATILVEGTVDGTNFITLSVLPIGAGLNVAQVASITAAGAWWGNANGLQQVRARVSAFTSGSATVVVRAMQAAGMVFNLPAGQTTQPVSGTVTANIGTGSIAAGTNAIGDVGVQYRANNTGAASNVNVMSPATPASATIKASAGRLLGWYLQNSAAGLRSVKIFNATAPTLGTTAATFEIDIPAGGVAALELPGGIGFATAMTYSVTSAKGLTDNTATGLAANDVSGFFAFA